MNFKIGSRSDPFSLVAVAQPLLLLAIVGAYLQPMHSVPWPAAISDGLFVCAGFILILAAWQLGSAQGGSLSPIEVMTGAALVIHALWFAFTTDNRSTAPYALVLLVAYICFKVSHRRRDLFLTLLTGIALAAVATSIIGGGQWLGLWDFLPNRVWWVVEDVPGTALSGNLSQRNNTGSLLVWGLISLVTLEAYVLSRKVPHGLTDPFAALTTTSVLLVAVVAALTQSRTTSLEIFALAGISIFYKKQCGQRVMSLILLGFVAHFFTVLLLPTITALLFDIPLTGVFGGKTMLDGARGYAYETFWQAVLLKPLWGYGLGGLGNAFLTAAPLDRGVGMVFGQAHNLLFDLLVCLGIPLGGWLAFQFARFFISAFSRVSSMNEIAALAMVSTLLIHAMLELPHHYAYFLIPLGVLCAQLPPSATGLSPMLRISKPWLLLAVTSTAVFFVALSIEYFRLEDEIRSARFQLAVTGQARPPSKEVAYFLTELKGADAMIRTPVVRGMTDAQLAAFEVTVRQIPMGPLLTQYALALEVNGRAEDAKQWRTLNCAIFQINPCPATLIRSEDLKK